MRRQSKTVTVRGVAIGGGSRVTVQSMTNTDTADRDATLAQIRALERCGCDIVRFTVNSAAAVANIPYFLEHTPLPLVADIHFDYKLAIDAAEAGISKIRINPGNIGDDDRVRAVARTCARLGVPVRVGVNGGSLEKQIAAKEKELENMKREVTNFRASLYGIYKEHLAVIEKIPTFDLPEEEQEEKAPAEEPTPVYTEPEVIEEPEEEIPVPAAQQVEEEPAPAPAEPKPAPAPVPEPIPAPAPVQPQPVYDKDSYIKEQFSGIGLDLNAYADIPESLQKEKEALFSTLEFGVEDEGDKKKGKFKRR